MAEERVDDGMIEIGDPTEDSPVPEAPPRVVIEYRERGVPWMLIPPLLLTSALGAFLLYPKLAPYARAPQPTPLVRAIVPPEPHDAPPALPDSPNPPVKDPVPVSPIEKPAEVALAPPVDPVVPPVDPVPPPPETDKVADPAPFPRVQGLGFDPKALEAERNGEAPADPSLAPAAQEARPEERDMPREVDPDLLPPDPRLGRIRQQQRVAESIKKAEADRTRFHTELAAVCRKFREDSGPEILELYKGYDTNVEPVSKKRAALLLGKTGPMAGADRETRINLLRSLGYPEPVILDDLFNSYEIHKINERGGPTSKGEAMYRAALFLIRHPPARPKSASRAVSAARPDPDARQSP